MVTQPLAQPADMPYTPQRETFLIEVTACQKKIFDDLTEISAYGFGRVEITVQNGKIMIVHMTKSWKPETG